MQVTERDIIAGGQQIERHGARAAEVDLPLPLAHLPARDEQVRQKDGRKARLVFVFSRRDPAAHLILKTLVGIFIFFQPRLVRVGQDVHEHPLARRVLEHDVIGSRFHGAHLCARKRAGAALDAAVNVDTQLFGQRRRRRKADGVVVVAADGEHAALPRRNAARRAVK